MVDVMRRRRGGPWRWYWSKGGPGRPPKPRVIGTYIGKITFIPYDENGVPLQGEPISLTPDELEALRLVYLENLKQEDAANKMGVSRGTLWRILESGRRKLVQALIEMRPIIVLPPLE